MLARIMEWLRKRPDPQLQEQHIQDIMRGLSSPEKLARELAQHGLANFCLNRYADYTPDDVIALLRALQDQTGLYDVDWILRQVEFLTHPSTTFGVTPELRAAAQQCIQRLRERAEPEYLPQTLLHPSSAPPVSPDMLLRPAQGVTRVQAETLLRPDESETRSHADAER